ncbi:MAG: 50S ribosomal protein L15 [Candidatus Pacebacteria bacterium]|nr:50S ribosomal protein L15 [Candidatus Paceibacterota bacterium]
MQFHQLKRVHKNKKRMTVARGGKRGKTSGRGGKGQSARAGNKRRPEWRDIIKRLPKLRGRGVNSHKAVEEAFKAINVSLIETIFNAGDMVTPTTLVEKGAVATFSGNIPPIKILGDGEITKAVKVSGCAFSASAKEKIEKAGGTVTAITPKVVVKNTGAAGIVGTPKVVVEPKKAVKKEKAKKEEGKTEKSPAKEKKAPVKKAKAE